jgi:hypothetical protein
MPDERTSPRDGPVAYFMIRIHPGPAAAGSPTGIVERLGSGRKHSFSGAEELLRLLTDWPSLPAKMSVSDGAGNG